MTTTIMCCFTCIHRVVVKFFSLFHQQEAIQETRLIKKKLEKSKETKSEANLTPDEPTSYLQQQALLVETKDDLKRFSSDFMNKYQVKRIPDDSWYENHYKPGSIYETSQYIGDASQYDIKDLVNKIVDD